MFTSGPRRCRGPVFFAAGYGGYGNGRLGLYAGRGSVHGLRLCTLPRYDGGAAAVGRDQIRTAHPAQAGVPGGESLLYGDAGQNRRRGTQAGTGIGGVPLIKTLTRSIRLEKEKFRIPHSVQDAIPIRRI